MLPPEPLESPQDLADRRQEAARLRVQAMDVAQRLPRKTREASLPEGCGFGSVIGKVEEGFSGGRESRHAFLERLLRSAACGTQCWPWARPARRLEEVLASAVRNVCWESS